MGDDPQLPGPSGDGGGDSAGSAPGAGDAEVAGEGADAAGAGDAEVAGGGAGDAGAGGAEVAGGGADAAGAGDAAAGDAAAAAGAAPAGWRARRRARLARRSRTRKWLTRGGITVVLLIVAIAAATVGYAGYRLHQIKKVAAPDVVAQQGPILNFLLIGSTSRCAASSIAQFKYQCIDQQVNGVNSDVVLIARLDTRNDTVSLLSIPRDTFVPGARSGSALCGTTSPLTPGLCANKIDSALVEGPNQLVGAIEQDFGIPINHIVDLNFATFESVVNALGGLWMYFPDRLVDASSGLDVHHTGCIHFNGSEALELVRARHLYYFTKGQTPNMAAIDAANTPSGPWYTPSSGGQYDGSGDLGRIIRVHEFLKALAEQVAARGLGNPITDNALIGAVAPNLTVDSSLSATTMVKLAYDFRHANLGSAPELTLPTVTNAATYYYYGADYGDVIFPTEPQDQQAIDNFLGSTPPGWKLSPGSISVSVVDGTNSPTQTSAVSSQLGALGFHMVPTAATRYVGPVAETTVVYDGPAHLAQAQKVMSGLSGLVVLGQGKPAAGADVSVITGSDFGVDKSFPAAVGTAPKLTASRKSGVHAPAGGHRASGSGSAPRASSTSAAGSVSGSHATGSTSPAAGSTTTAASTGATAASTKVPAVPPPTVPTTTDPNLGLPTSPVQGITPWDPRAVGPGCPPPGS